ncbi:MAG: Co2+/Mg2+ efflux protein ApaG [Pseudomonadota bacterium]
MVRGKPPPSYEATTQGMRIRVMPRFMHDESEPAKSKFVWAYTVDIENGSDLTWTLTTRHWQIIDAMGRTQTVDGDGVVGQTPRLEPGESFRYTSGCPLTAPSGVMGGSYDFVGDAGEALTAKVPTFSLDSPYDRAKPS